MTAATYQPFSQLEELALAGLKGSAFGIMYDPNDLSTPTGLSKKATMADIRTALLGGTLAGYNAADPLNAGNGTFSGTLNVTGAATFGSTTTLHGLAYTWPSSQAANRYLKTDGSGTLTWASILETLALTDLSDVTITTPSAGQILAYNGAGVWLNSSDGTALNVSASLLTVGTVPSARVSGAYAGITGLGTIATGTWQATPVTTVYGGTGLAAYTAGDTLYYASGSTLTKLALGTAAQYKRVNAGGTAPEWHTLVAADITNPAALTRTDDTNVTLTLGGAPTTALLTAASLTLGWTGTLAAARLNANVVQAFTNDTNVTASISAQVATIAWSGQLAVGRGGTGLSTFTAAGGMAYATAATTLAVLAIGAANTVMLSTGSAPSWVAQSTLTAPAGLLTGTTLAANVVTSSLTTIGTLVGGAVPASLVTAGTFAAGAFAFQSTVSLTGLTFTTTLTSTTAAATPGVMSATQGTNFASTTLGAATMGYGTTFDVSLINRAGTTVLGIGPNTTTTTLAGALVVAGSVTGVTTLATSSTINGQTISASAVLTGTLTVASALSVTAGALLSGTDATYDIGANGASRFNNLWLAGNAKIGKQVLFTDATSFSAAMSIRGNGAALLFNAGTGGFIWNSATDAATLATMTNAGAVTFTSSLAIAGALTGATTGAFSSTITFTGGTFTTTLQSATGVSAPTLAATGVAVFASIVNGGSLQGYGTTYDVSLLNRAGSVVLGNTANTTGIVIPGALAVSAATTLTQTFTMDSAGAGYHSYFGTATTLYSSGEFVSIKAPASSYPLTIQSQTSTFASLVLANAASGTTEFISFRDNGGTARAYIKMDQAVADLQIIANFGLKFYYGATLAQTIASGGAITMASSLAITGALSGVTTLGLSGLMTSTSTGAISTAISGTTQAMYHRLKNTSGEIYFGLESSAGGGTFTGSTAYAGVIYTASATVKTFQIITSGSAAGTSTFDTTGVTMGGTLGVTGAVTIGGTITLTNGFELLWGTTANRIFHNATNFLIDTGGVTRLTITDAGASTFSGALTASGLLTASAGLTIAAGQDLKLGNAYVAGVVAATGTVILKDSTGTAYRVSCAL